MINFIKELYSHVNADNIALLSVIITLLIYFFTRNAEIKYKKLEDKKIQYAKVIELLERMYDLSKDKNNPLTFDQETKKLFFDTGSSLLLYGSKKIYRLYILFREFTNNPLTKICKYYDKELIIYIIAEILVTMRKEVGLSWFNSLPNNEALGFFINDRSNPIARTDAINAKFKLRMIRFELFIIDRTKLIWLKKIYSITIKPICAALLIILKYVVLVPLGKIMFKITPDAKDNSHK